MSSSRSYLPLILASSLLFVGAGCGSTTSPAQPPEQAAPAPIDSNPMTPPTGDGDHQMPSAAPTSTGGAMKQAAPPALTETQTKELAAGEADHEPTTLTFHVVGGSFYYVPNMIKVKKGDKVKIIFDNAGGMHNFVLDEFGVKIDPIKSGETQSVEFIADKAGTFEYYCSVGSHRQMGQKGQLIVTE